MEREFTSMSINNKLPVRRSNTEMDSRKQTYNAKEKGDF